MGGFMFAWLLGEGIIVYRWVKNGAPPTPGALLLPSGLYVGLAIMAEYAPARFAATALAWGFDVAILLQVVGKAPAQKTGWPPAMINDPTVLLPGGASGGANQPVNPATAQAQANAGSKTTGTSAAAGGIFPTPTGQAVPGTLPSAG